LHQLAETMKADFQQRNLGEVFPVLWEAQKEQQEDGQIKVLGYTPNYLRVATLISADQCLENRITKVKLASIFSDYLIAQA
jgi:threonylcarbamoyladenosine tRNA methylthiotransferase MtaB